MKRIIFVTLLIIVNSSLAFSSSFFYSLLNEAFLENFYTSYIDEREFTFGQAYLSDDSGIGFHYDKNGNRVSRRVISLKSLSASADSSKLVHPITGELESGYNIVVYPNPTKGELRIDVRGPSIESGEISIYSLNGTLLFTERDVIEINILNLSDLASGVYIMRVRLDESVSEWKLVKE